MMLKEKLLRFVVDATGAVLIVCVSVLCLLAYFDVLTK